jgi:hypothetical protein
VVEADHSEASAALVLVGAVLDEGMVEVVVEGTVSAHSLAGHTHNDVRVSLMGWAARLARDRQKRPAVADTRLAKGRQRLDLVADGPGTVLQAWVLAQQVS